MITHHPSEDLLLAAATRALDAGAAMVVGAHLEVCDKCRQGVTLLEDMAGAMLSEIEPASMPEDALGKTLAAIDATAPAAAAPAVALSRPPLPTGVAWPRSLTGCTVSRWRFIGPGIRWSRITPPHGRQANVLLLRVGKGRSLPRHAHRGQELAHVLFGCLNNGRVRLGAGDFDAANETVRHQPRLEADDECVCLISVEGGLVFDGIMARIAGSILGI